MTKSAELNCQQIQRDFNPWIVYGFCLVVSLVFMFFFGLNSPIHTFNSHCDYQWFMTMGRGWLAGKIPYRDLFDHKGPITYAVFAFACLFPNPQFVIWCIEILCISLFLYFCYRIARKFLSPWVALAVVPLMMMVLSTNYARGLEGSCVEEYCLPIFAYGLLCFLDFLMDRKPVTWRRSLALGICFGILFWVKFSMLEFFIIPLLIWVIVNLIEHRLTTVVRSGLIMLGGFIVVTLPIVIGFVALGAFDDLFEVYLVINLTLYDGSFQSNGEEFIMNPWMNFFVSLLLGVYFSPVLILGLVCFAVRYWHQKSGWLLLIASFFTWLLLGFFCGYQYYYLPLYAYAVLGIIYTIKIVIYFFKKIDIVISGRTIQLVTVLIVSVISFLMALPFVGNVVEINRPRKNYTPIVVADIIADYNKTAEQPATLFCYRMAACGFYNAAGIIPNVRYYAQSSFTIKKFPIMFEAFDQTIVEQKCDFVLTYRSQYEANQDWLLAYYHPYFNNNLELSTLPYIIYDGFEYGDVKGEVVLLFRNN